MRTDRELERERHDEANSRFSQLCERNSKKKKATLFCHYSLMQSVQLLCAD